jgi:hypothetical protein
MNRAAFHGMREEKFGFKIGQKLAPLPPVSAVFFLSLSLHRSSHQPEPPPTSPPLAPPQVAIPTKSSWARPSQLGRPSPHVFNNIYLIYIILYYIYFFFKKRKKSKKNSKILWKKL